MHFLVNCENILLDGIASSVCCNITPLLFYRSGKKYLRGVAVSPSIPRTEAGYYWGYCVRFAHSLGAVFTEAPFKVRMTIMPFICCLSPVKELVVYV